MYYRRCFFILESETVLTAEEQKEKIRRRYQGINPDELEVIPALPQDSIYEDKIRQYMHEFPPVTRGKRHLMNCSVITTWMLLTAIRHGFWWTSMPMRESAVHHWPIVMRL